MTHHEWEHVQDATKLVRSRWKGAPRVGLVLGTGLGALAREIDAEALIPYPESLFFHGRRSKVTRATGLWPARRTVGRRDGRPVHLYEGYSPWQVTFPIRVMKELGCELLIVSNAAGGLNPLHNKGDLIVIKTTSSLWRSTPWSAE